MARRYYSSTAVATTLAAPATNAATSIEVTALTGYPVSTPWTAVLSPDSASEEVVEVTNVAGTTLTVTRGVDGTSGQAHSAGAVFRHSVSARDFNEPNRFLNLPKTNGYVLTADDGETDGVIWAEASAGDAFPTQTGNGGKLLTTDGTDPSWTSQVTSLNVIAAEEKTNIVASAATGTINLDALTASIWHYTTNASANHTLNIRGNSGTTLDSLLAVGDSITVVWLINNGTTAYFPTTIQVDGSAVTPKWLDANSPPTAAQANQTAGLDAFTFTVIKTAADPTYTVLGSWARYR
jgi:hypothetical protein